jgi:hypothetical protein
VKKTAGGLAPKQPPAGYTGLIRIGVFFLDEDVVAAGIRNLREGKNAERDVVRVRRWSIVPRRKKCGMFGISAEPSIPFQITS